MPITQDRMISLIRAARDYQDALQAAVTYIRRSAKIAREGKATAEEQLEYLETILDPIGLLRDPMTSSATIATEESHFKSTAARNRANAKWNASKRLRNGIRPQRQQNHGELRRELELPEAPSTTAPASISRESRLKGSVMDIIEDQESGIEEIPIIRPRGQKAPVMTGPRDAPGLYDPPDDEGPLITGKNNDSD